ncbi:MAG TPA: hypothetical protein VF080_10305, partial [Solirubrobacteraceae bacterium]
EAEALLVAEPLHGSGSHVSSTARVNCNAEDAFAATTPALNTDFSSLWLDLDGGSVASAGT